MSVDTRIAPRRIRLLAGLIDGIVGLLGTVGLSIVSMGATFAYMRVSEREPSDSGAEETFSEFWQSAWLQRALHVATLGLAVLGRNWRSPGYRVLGLRRVDARSGGPVTVRSAVAGAVFDFAWQSVTTGLSRPRLKREFERLSPLQAQMKEIQRQHADDPDARQRALMELYRTNPVSPFRGCTWALLPGLLVQLFSLVCARRAQTIRDRVTRTVVTVEQQLTDACGADEERESSEPLVGELRARGVIRSELVETAFLNVPRERFLADAVSERGLEDVYRDDAIVTKRDPHGMPLSSSSQHRLTANASRSSNSAETPPLPV